MKKILLLILITCTFAGYSQKVNVKKLIKEANKGNVQAQTELSDRYFKGKGVRRSYEQAIFWLTKVAESGNVEAQLQLANHYFEGKKIRKSNEKGVFWLEKVAESGDKNAQYSLAKYYKKGIGVKESPEKYVYWLNKVSDDIIESQIDLAYCYKDGYGVGKDIEEAYKWLKKAIAQNNAEAKYTLGLWIILEKKDSENIDKEGFSFIQESAEQGYPEAQFFMAISYLKGKGVEKSVEDAVDWIEKAAKQGHSKAQGYLGYFLQKGIGGLPIMKKKAVYWYNQSAKKGDADAQNLMGLCYEYGDYVKQSNKAAVYWYTQSARQGNLAAQNNLGVCYNAGRGINKSVEKAIELYEKSIKDKEGREVPLYNLGVTYLRKNNRELGLKYLYESAEKGFSIALKTIGDLYYEGHYHRQSYEEAIKYYRKALENVRKDSILESDASKFQLHIKMLDNYSKSEIYYNLSKCYDKGNGVAKSEKEALEYAIKSAHLSNEDAFKLLLKKAQAGNIEAQLEVGTCYQYGLGVERSSAKAFNWVKKSAEQGDSDAQNRLASYYYEGIGVLKSIENVLYWAEKSVKQRNPMAQWNLARYYLDISKDSVPLIKDEIKGMSYLHASAGQGHSEALNYLGTIYEEKQEYEKAFESFLLSAENRNLYGQYNLGRCYEKGIGVEKSYEKAMNWYLKSARQGNPSAQFRIGRLYHLGEGIKQSEFRALNWFEKACENNHKQACECLEQLKNREKS
ncbi:hypothetical protein AB4865_02430 [Capnocytophaga sp. ARDL2]|uniref:hypothetical protein n=1 Tax=Capnocytophaga sp. ARDL2 TaxID=3238809 RepID=UPI0035571B1C